MHHYVVVRRDLPLGVIAAQVVHAAGESFYQFAALDNAMLVALVNGRNVISNVQAEFTGFIDPDQSWEKFKAELYEKIRELSVAPLNKAAQDHYLGLADPEKFREAVEAMQKPIQEAVNV